MGVPRWTSKDCGAGRVTSRQCPPAARCRRRGGEQTAVAVCCVTVRHVVRVWWPGRRTGVGWWCARTASGRPASPSSRLARASPGGRLPSSSGSAFCPSGCVFCVHGATPSWRPTPVPEACWRSARAAVVGCVCRYCRGWSAPIRGRAGPRRRCPGPRKPAPRPGRSRRALPARTLGRSFRRTRSAS